MKTKFTTSYILTVILTVLMVLQSIAGLIIPNLYRDTNWVISAMRANDLVTLCIAIPLLIITLFLLRRNPSHSAKLVWTGVLYYSLYNNMYYIFGTTFNLIFPIYVAIFILSTFALIASFIEIIIPNSNEQYRPTISIKWVVGYMIFFSILLTVMWIGQWLMFVIKGEVPKIIQDTGGLTHLVAALDLSMIVSPIILGVFWMLKHRELGYIISTILMIQCTLTCIVLIVTAPFQSAANIADAWTMLPLWIITGIGCFVSSIVLLRNVQLIKSIK